MSVALVKFNHRLRVMQETVMQLDGPPFVDLQVKFGAEFHIRACSDLGLPPLENFMRWDEDLGLHIGKINKFFNACSALPKAPSENLEKLIDALEHHLRTQKTAWLLYSNPNRDWENFIEEITK